MAESAAGSEGAKGGDGGASGTSLLGDQGKDAKGNIGPAKPDLSKAFQGRKATDAKGDAGKGKDAKGSDAKADDAKPDQKPDTKPADKDGKKADEKNDDASRKVAKRSLVNETTEIVLPDGYTIEQDDVDDLIDRASEAGMSVDDLQRWVEFDADRQKRAGAARVAAVAKQSDAWVDTIRKDKDLGGDNFNQSVADAKNAIRKVGSPALVKLAEMEIDGGKLGSHPEFFRLVAWVGKQLRESKLSDGGRDKRDSGTSTTPSQKGKDARRRLVPEWSDAKKAAS